jgi:serine/threonine protein kinase
MAQVWIARMRGRHGFERIVAVKTILPKYAEEPAFQKMFLDEARIASGIMHANVAQTLDLGEEHGVLYIVMEVVDGDALTRLLAAVSKRTRRMPYGAIMRILADTCGGLHAAHELRGADGHNLGIIHRDVSPQNILVSVRGEAKLIDFGIAKAKDRLSGETASGLVKGKIKYMAPEQALGRTIDRRIDVYAIGAILYRVIAGRPPYIGANELETLHALTSGKQPPPLPQEVPPAIASVTMRALANDVAHRFQTAAEMQSAMEQAMVDAGCATTTYDIQEIVADHLLDRAAARKQTLELALMAAKERERMAQLLQPAEADSSSGIVDVGSRAAPLSRRSLTARPPARPTPTPANYKRPADDEGDPTTVRPAADDDDPTTVHRPADEDGDPTTVHHSDAPPGAPAARIPPAAGAPVVPMAPPLAAMPPLALDPPALAQPLPPMRPRSASHDVLTALSDPRRRQLSVVVAAALAGLAVVMLIAIALTRGEGEAHAVATASMARWVATLRVPEPPPPPPAASSVPSVESPYALATATSASAAPKTFAVPQAAPPPPPPKPTASAAPKKPRPDVDGF